MGVNAPSQPKMVFVFMSEREKKYPYTSAGAEVCSKDTADLLSYRIRQDAAATASVVIVWGRVVLKINPFYFCHLLALL
jgi:hypothetical protein